MAFMGYEMMEARIRISGIFGRLIEILLEEYREGERGEDEKESAKSNLNKILITRMLTEYVGSRVKNTSDTLGYYYSTVMSYAGKL